jgi:hypothetical protein
VQILTENVNLRMQYINTEILRTEMEVSNEAKNVIPLKLLRKIKNIKILPLVNPIRGHAVDDVSCVIDVVHYLLIHGSSTY